MKTIRNTDKIQFPLFLILCLFSANTFASKAKFDYQATYKRNKSIWGTYKLQREGLSIKRGKLSWSEFPKGRVGDIILSKGNFILLRETVVDEETKIIVDKIPYKKVGKNIFINKSPLKKDVLDRLYQNDIQNGVPHKDLKEGSIQYQTIRCKKTRGSLNCAITGEISP